MMGIRILKTEFNTSPHSLIDNINQLHKTRPQEI